MTGDEQHDTGEAREAAAALAAWVDTQLASGADPSTVAVAMLGLGVDLLAQSQGLWPAGFALEGLAKDITVMNDDDRSGNTNRWRRRSPRVLGMP